MLQIAELTLERDRDAQQVKVLEQGHQQADRAEHDHHIPHGAALAETLQQRRLLGQGLEHLPIGRIQRDHIALPRLEVAQAFTDPAGVCSSTESAPSSPVRCNSWPSLKASKSPTRVTGRSLRLPS